MRLWSLHPVYLDSKGLVAGWREALLAQKVLRGATHGYRSHPQLQRFKEAPDPQAAMSAFLRGLQEEATRRGYNFDAGKILPGPLLAAEIDVAEPGPSLHAVGFSDVRAQDADAGVMTGYGSGPETGQEDRQEAGQDSSQSSGQKGGQEGRTPLPRIPVTDGQVAYEAELLLFKLRMRAPQTVDSFQEAIRQDRLRLHPLFELTSGPVASWEKVRSDL